jgi:hypothetical protein
MAERFQEAEFSGESNGGTTVETGERTEQRQQAEISSESNGGITVERNGGTTVETGERTEQRQQAEISGESNGGITVETGESPGESPKETKTEKTKKSQPRQRILNHEAFVLNYGAGTVSFDLRCQGCSDRIDHKCTWASTKANILTKVRSFTRNLSLGISSELFDSLPMAHYSKKLIIRNALHAEEVLSNCTVGARGQYMLYISDLRW